MDNLGSLFQGTQKNTKKEIAASCLNFLSVFWANHESTQSKIISDPIWIENLPWTGDL